MGKVIAVDQITIDGAIKLCDSLGASEEKNAKDFAQIAKYLVDYRKIKQVMEDSAFAQITKSKWTKVGELNIYCCDLCGGGTKEMTQFCPHCGSFMTNGGVES